MIRLTQVITALSLVGCAAAPQLAKVQSIPAGPTPTASQQPQAATLIAEIASPMAKAVIQTAAPTLARDIEDPDPMPSPAPSASPTATTSPPIVEPTAEPTAEPTEEPYIPYYPPHTPGAFRYMGEVNKMILNGHPIGEYGAGVLLTLPDGYNWGNWELRQGEPDYRTLVTYQGHWVDSSHYLMLLTYAFNTHKRTKLKAEDGQVGNYNILDWSDADVWGFQHQTDDDSFLPYIY